MRSTELLLCIFALAWGLSNAELTCYSCQGNDNACPYTVNESTELEDTTCGGVLKTVCAKFAIEYLNGDYYTYRNCAPSSIEYGDQEVDFCRFIYYLYQPIEGAALINNTECLVCNDFDCNT